MTKILCWWRVALNRQMFAILKKTYNSTLWKLQETLGLVNIIAYDLLSAICSIQRCFFWKVWIKGLNLYRFVAPQVVCFYLTAQERHLWRSEIYPKTRTHCLAECGITSEISNDYYVIDPKSCYVIRMITIWSYCLISNTLPYCL